MSEESRRVLDLLTQGKITVDEADRLLAAVGTATATAGAGAESAKGEATSGEGASPKYLRITVTKARSWPDDDAKHARRAWMWPGVTGGQNGEVSIRVPVTLVRNGMRLGAMIPGLSGAGHRVHLRERGVDIDLSKIDAGTIDQLVREFGEINIDIESGRGAKAQVRITTE